MWAVVPAAGRGSRLGERTVSTPKPLLDVGGRPVISWVFAGLAEAGVDGVVVVTGHLADRLEQVVDGLAGVPVVCVRQGPEPGTARALLAAREVVGDEPFLYAWGDLVLAPAGFVAVASAAGTAVVGVNRVDDPSAGAAIEVDAEMRVTRVVEKPPPGTSSTRWNHTGIGRLPESAWGALAAVPPSPRGEYELTDVLAGLAERALLRAVAIEGPVFDVGTPETLALARSWADHRRHPDG